jgi:hypothetical protein
MPRSNKIDVSADENPIHGNAGFAKDRTNVNNSLDNTRNRMEDSMVINQEDQNL